MQGGMCYWQGPLWREVKQERRPEDRIGSSGAVNFNSVAMETSRDSRRVFRRWAVSKPQGTPLHTRLLCMGHCRQGPAHLGLPQGWKKVFMSADGSA